MDVVCNTFAPFKLKPTKGGKKYAKREKKSFKSEVKLLITIKQIEEKPTAVKVFNS